MTRPGFLPYRGDERTDAEIEARAVAFAAEASRRRTVRDFSSRPIPKAVLTACLAAAGSAPSGANRQPWHFVVVTDVATRSRIRAAAEEEERAFYHGRAPDAWLAALEPLGTTADKPFLETAPCLIAIFAETHRPGADGQVNKNYYVQESVGIATGVLITALHHAGLATLTHTPSPMAFLNEILGRPAHERPFLLLVVGHPAADATVPDIQRKPVREIVTYR